MTLEDRIRAKRAQTEEKVPPVVHTVEASSYEYDCGICGEKHTGPCPQHPEYVASPEESPSAQGD